MYLVTFVIHTSGAFHSVSLRRGEAQTKYANFFLFIRPSAIY